MKAKPVGFHTDLLNELPISIGTIPLIEAQPMPNAPMTGYVPGPSVPLMPMPSPSAPPLDGQSYPNMRKYPL